MTGVVPHPGATFPYSEFNGFNAVPSGVILLVDSSIFALDVVPVAIVFLQASLDFFDFLSYDRSGTEFLNIFVTYIMETPAFVATIFVWCLLLSITGYSLYIGFGPPSKELRDPFDEHED
jgi:PsbN protein